MSDPESSHRERSLGRYSTVLNGLVLVIGIGLAWHLWDPNATPSSSDDSAMSADSTAAINTNAPKSTPSRRPQMEEIIGHSSNQKPIDYDRCDAKARSEMNSLIVRIGVEKVVLRESAWAVRSTSTRVGIASWLSECTQENGPVTIFGDESAGPLATYDRETGYAPLPMSH